MRQQLRIVAPEEGGENFQVSLYFSSHDHYECERGWRGGQTLQLDVDHQKQCAHRHAHTAPKRYDLGRGGPSPS